MAVDHDSSLFIVPVRKVQGYEMHRDELGAGYNALRGLRRRAGINNPQLPSLGLQLLLCLNYFHYSKLSSYLEIYRLFRFKCLMFIIYY